MRELQAALYARVSSEQQAQAHTIASQLAALRTRIAVDGLVLPPQREYIEEGYSGATLVRPALERLRDLAAADGIDRLYVHSPDRLARKYAYQVLLLDEFQSANVQVLFLPALLRDLRQSRDRSLAGGGAAAAGARICCCRCREWSPSTSAPRSSNAADG